MSKLEVGDEKYAGALSDKLHHIFSELETMVRETNERVDEEQGRAFRQAIGSVCGSLVLDVLGPLYRSYPAIRPENWPQEE